MKQKIITTNRKAQKEYIVLEKIEAGIQLKGSEVKSLREGKATLQDSFARIENNEIWLYNLHISTYEKIFHFKEDPKKVRKLLLHRKEISRLIGQVTLKGLTLIPLSLYFSPRGIVKVELALARGRKLYDKRRWLKEKDIKRQAEEDIARFMRRKR